MNHDPINADAPQRDLFDTMSQAEPAAERHSMSQAHHTFINDITGVQFVEGIYCIQNAQLGMTRSGKPFLKALIRDRSGQIAARMWSMTEERFKTLPVDGFVWLEGQTQAYQGEWQLIVQDIRAAEVEKEDLVTLLPTTDKNIDEMFKSIRQLLGTLEHPDAKALADEYLADEALMKNFRTAPAAVTLHHAYLGGLLEHTLQLCQLADRMLPLYPKLNRDIVILGLFLHDMAKCGELTYDAGFAYSDEGQLMGHIVMGSLWLERYAAKAAQRRGSAPINREALLVLHHIILSHHGQPEFGAARLPSTPEAVFVSRLDELDAKTQMAVDHGRGESAAFDPNRATFTEKVWALGTRLYRPDPLASSDE